MRRKAGSTRRKKSIENFLVEAEDVTISNPLEALHSKRGNFSGAGFMR